MRSKILNAFWIHHGIESFEAKRFEIVIGQTGTDSDNQGMQTSDTPPLRLTHIDPVRNMARYYAINIQPTLFGEVSILRNWGRIGTRGQGMMVTFDDLEQAHQAQQKLAAQKRRRGYADVPT